MFRVFQHQRGVILGRRENLSEKLVIFCCTIVGLFISLVCICNPQFDIILCILTYFFVFWVLPAISYVEGLEKRKEGKLVWWCLTVFVHVLGMDFSCVMIIYNHITSPYLHFDTTCIVAIVLLVITPLFLVPLFLPVIVYLHMDKDVMVIQSRQVKRPPRRHMKG